MQKKTMDAVGKRILLVEDTKIISIGTCLALENMGCMVDVAETGCAAIEQFTQIAYDFVYMDIGLPDIQGIEVTRRIREWEQARDKAPTPIVALTAELTPKIEAQCLAVGMQGVLAKPFNRELTQALLAQYC